jgi:hypothetical protein
LGVVVHACNSRIWEAEAVRSQGQSGLHSDFQASFSHMVSFLLKIFWNFKSSGN